jgi:hypothetical protein
MVSTPPAGAETAEEEKGLTFTPPLWTQRLDLVRTTIFDLDISEVCDLGCGSGKLLIQLKEARCARLLLGVDMDKPALAAAWEELEAGFQDFHFRRKSASTLRLYYGDILVPSPSIPYQIQCVTLCEVIEHIPECEVPTLTRLIFRHINPKYCIVTTPNSDFNVNFGRLGFRHPDHKFEWTREQFQQWIKQVVNEYKYEVNRLTGVGDIGNGTGHCSQIVILKRSDAGRRLTREIVAETYQLMREVTYPVAEKVTFTQAFSNAVIYHVYSLFRHNDLEGNELTLGQVYTSAGELQAFSDGEYAHFLHLLEIHREIILKKAENKLIFDITAEKVAIQEDNEEEEDD